MYTNSYTGTLIVVIVETLQTTGELYNYLPKKDRITITISDIVDVLRNSRWNRKGGIN